MKKIYKTKCPVCGYYTLNGKNEYDICLVCGWEDDGNEKYPDEDFGPNQITFNEAKRLWSSNIKFNDLLIIREPFGIEIPNDSEEYLNIKKYIDEPEKYYKEAIEALEYEIGHGLIDEKDLQEAKNKAFTIFNALAFLDSKIGKKSAIRLALCYANGYGCKKNMYTATSILDKVEDLYDTYLDNVTIKHVNYKDIVNIKLCDKTNPKYLKVLTDLLSKKLSSNRYGVDKCDVIDNNSISIVADMYKNDDIDMLKDIRKIFEDFLKIKTVMVDPKAYNNSHEGIAYFNGAQSVLRQYLKKEENF